MSWSTSQLTTLTQDLSIHDPPLSDLGVQQCHELRDHLRANLPLVEDAELIIVSPMRRTLQTAQEGLGWLIDRGVPVVPRAEWQENSNQPCDTGTPMTIIVKDYPQFNFDKVPSEWPVKEGRWKFSQAAITQRGIDCRRWLKSRPEKVIVVVGHSAFFRLGISPTRFGNADYRVFGFEEHGDMFVQWPLTEDNGGGMGRSPKGQDQAKPSDFGLEEFEIERRNPQVDTEAAKEMPT